MDDTSTKTEDGDVTQRKVVACFAATITGQNVVLTRVDDEQTAVNFMAEFKKFCEREGLQLQDMDIHFHEYSAH